MTFHLRRLLAPIPGIALAATLLLAGCVHHVPQLPAQWRAAEPDVRASTEGLRETVQALVEARVNLKRTDAAEQRARLYGLPVTREGIDWFSMQDNLVIELPGETKRLIYLVAHVDKTDMNLLKVLSIMVNGALDEPINFTTLSEGAIDNASGVAVVLETARALANSRRTHTLRVLLTGSEESGLRGARAHVARIPNEEWPLIDAVINVDSVGLRGQPTCVVKNESEPSLVARAHAAAAAAKVPLEEEDMPLLGGGDHSAFDHTSFFHDFGRGLLFNVTGGVLPQRSWFTGFHHAPVVAFFSCHLLDAGDWISGVVALPVGQLHGPRDNASALDPERLGEAFLIVRGLAAELAGTAVTGTDLR